jgi:hypothetical protein|tara:strand:+ start:7097 stop:7330 length:234 start_codon:yes stop_codon:yes gene_type:complete
MNLSEAKQHIELLEWEVKTLKETQLAFQNELIKEVQRINSMPPFKRWWNTAKLLFGVLSLIVDSIDKANRKTNGMIH